eukprot:TRINITY_DN11812_c0_g1_i1.p1 TRINITY_DN11812_c0_g1~~TRINITY_DN11812_c0_g1_i1.p1  ORF type:complete len:304 (-),score=54.71 TRINITY_DN11812_c0_g1_i1:49-960(-)
MASIEFSLPTQPKKKTKTKLNIQHAVPGSTIAAEAGFLRGHGTYVTDNNLCATVSGVVERVNKLISVRPLKARYTAEVGDVVIGRITEVGQKRWRVDINSRQDGILMLSSVNLPGGVLRRRTNLDELNMRNFFVENDLIIAEVQQFFSDGAIALHTRSMKYGKLINGQFVSVPPALIKRTKQSFNSLTGIGIDVILGNNGYIWIAETPENPDDAESQNILGNQLLSTSCSLKEISPETRERICRVRNSLVALASQFIAIYPATIIDTYESSIQMSLQAKEMLKPPNIERITKAAADRKGKGDE